MNKVFVFISLVIGAILVAVILPIVNDQIDGVKYEEVSESFTAVEDVATQEVVTVENVVYSVTSVTVEGSELTTEQYSRVGKVFTLDADASVATNEIIVTYQYEDITTSNQVNLLVIIPLIIAIAVVVYFVKGSRG